MQYLCLIVSLIKSEHLSVQDLHLLQSNSQYIKNQPLVKTCDS